jgi:hypothetical protein
MSRRSRGGITLEDVSSMLIEGGYFRAKIRTLTEFDKIAGGLAWGILNSRFSIDVEFVENAVIKDKIRIAENICRALKDDMNCPFDLDPHQIQGLDYPKIAIVLEWLLKRVAAAREENAYFVSEFTKLDFRRRFGADIFGKAKAARGAKATAAPARVMISTRTEYANDVEHSSTVLLEYGLKYQMKDSLLMLQHAAELDGDAEMQRDVAKMQEDENREQAMLDALLGQMAQHREKSKLSSTVMSSVMQTADSDKIQRLKDVYEQRKAELQARLDEEERERNELEAQRQRLRELEEEDAQLDSVIAAKEEELKTAAAQNASAGKKCQSKIDRIEREINDVDEIEKMLRSDPARAAQFDSLLELLASLDRANEKIDQDRLQSKQRIADAKQECVDLANRLEMLASDEGRERFEAELKKLQQQVADANTELSKKDQEVMNELRKIDEFPTRAELRQYEVRIDELNEEVAWKFAETRLNYETFNTRAEVVKCLANESTILTQIGELFESCMSEKASSKKVAADRQILLDQTTAIISQIEGSKQKQKEKHSAEMGNVAAAQRRYTELTERQREYQQLVEAFKELMEENAALKLQAAELLPETADAEADDPEEEA